MKPNPFALDDGTDGKLFAGFPFRFVVNQARGKLVEMDQKIDLRVADPLDQSTIFFLRTTTKS